MSTGKEVNKFLPKSGYALFVKLYCKKRNVNKTGNILLEAMKSWITLNPEEKQMFIDKFKECKTIKKKSFAQYLKKTEPYLKKKYSLSSQIEPEPLKPDEDVMEQSNIPQLKDVKIHENICASTNTHIENVSWSPTSDNRDGVDNNHSRSDTPNISPVAVLPEPEPPKIRNSMELFDLVKAEVEDPNSSWLSLSQTKKRFYQKAVYQLKKNYIRNYKAFLESLPSKELFIYYHKNIN